MRKSTTPTPADKPKPGFIIARDPRDAEVLGPDFTGLPLEPETTTELIQAVNDEIDEEGQ